MATRSTPMPIITTDVEIDSDTEAQQQQHLYDKHPSPTSAVANTDPEASALFQALRAEINQQRPRSPYPRTHHRSHSALSALSAPPMARTRSLPMYETRQRLASPSPSHSPVRPSSPMHSAGHSMSSARASPRRSLEDMRPPQLNATPSFMEIESIAEDSELDITPTSRRPATLDTPFTPHSSSHSLSRSGSGRRRPASPLQQFSAAYGNTSVLGNGGPPPSPSSASSTSSLAPPPSPSPPAAGAARFNETYPSLQPLTTTHSTSSSMPSTPTSFRSRSPSISSLETIPDSPDAEAEATEEDAIRRLKAAADAEEMDEERRNAGLRVGGGVGRGRMGGDAAKRKRWSVCGAERRGDFEMETIWED